MKQSTIFSRIFIFALALTLILVACEKSTPGQEQQEANEAEATAVPEGTAPEQTAPEVATPEAVAPEDTTPEETSPEGTTPEEAAPEGTTPEETAPEGTTPDDTAPAVDPTPDPNVGGGTGNETAVTPVPAGGTTYTVSAGENFFRIGLNHNGCTVAEMAAVNPAVVPPNYTIYIGQTLVIPNCQ